MLSEPPQQPPWVDFVDFLRSLPPELLAPVATAFALGFSLGQHSSVQTHSHHYGTLEDAAPEWFRAAQEEYREENRQSRQ